MTGEYEYPSGEEPQQRHLGRGAIIIAAGATLLGAAGIGAGTAAVDWYTGLNDQIARAEQGDHVVDTILAGDTTLNTDEEKAAIPHLEAVNEEAPFRVFQVIKDGENYQVRVEQVGGIENISDVVVDAAYAHKEGALTEARFLAGVAIVAMVAGVVWLLRD